MVEIDPRYNSPEFERWQTRPSRLNNAFDNFNQREVAAIGELVLDIDGSHSTSPFWASVDQTPTDEGFTDVVATALDVCSLSAAKIRSDVIKMLVGETDSNATKMAGATISEIDLSDGFKSIIYGDKDTPDRIVTEIARDKDLKLIAWTDARPGRMFGLRDTPHDDDSLAMQPIEFGLGKVGIDGRQLFVPLLKSIVSSNGCDVVIPRGSEADPIAYNKKTVLSVLESIVDTGTSHAVDAYQVTDLLRVVHDALLTNPDGINLQKFIERVVAPRSTTIVDSLLKGELDSVRRTKRRLQVIGGEWEDMDIVGNTFETDKLIDNETRKRQFEYFLQDRGVLVEDNGEVYKEFVLWGGLDPDEYTQPGVAVMFPRYVIRQADFGRPEIGVYPDGTFSKELEPTEKQMNYLMHVMDVKLGNFRNHNQKRTGFSAEDELRERNRRRSEIIQDVATNRKMINGVLLSDSRTPFPPRPKKRQRSFTGIEWPRN